MMNKKCQPSSTKNISLNFLFFDFIFILAISTLTFISPTEVQVTKHAQKFLIMNVFMEYEKNSSNMFNLFDKVNPLYGKIKLGSNKQELIMRVKLHTYSTIVSGDKEINKNYKLYDFKSSETYSVLENQSYTSKEFLKGILSQDVATFSDKDKIDDFHFFYAEKLSKKLDISSGIIGLDLKKQHTIYGPNFHSHSINFVDQLQAHQIIDEYGVTVILDRKDRKRGKLFFGPDLDDIFDEFKDCLKTRVNAGDDTNDDFVRWGFIFDSMRLGNNELTGGTSVRLKFSNDFILSTDDYSYKIMDLFFNELIEKNICKENDLTISYYKYITCNKKVLESFDKFPTLTFIGTDVNKDPFHIDFTADDLFEDIEGTIYFKVIIMKPASKFMTANDEWKIGKIFFRKYVVTLDRRRRTITFYTRTNLVNIYNVIKDNTDGDKTKIETKDVKQSTIEVHSYNINITFIVMISFIIVLTSVIGVISLRKSKKNKKKDKKMEKNSDNGEEMTYYSIED